jgi:tetratricopeptide (TPR) repeat protein
MTRQRLEDAAKHLQRALAAEPREPEVHLYMARLLLEYQDRLPQAISHLRNVLTLAPDHPQRGQILGLIENLEEVLRSQGPPEPER